MKLYLSSIVFAFISLSVCGQSLDTFQQKTYVSTELNYRSYGTNDIVGLGGGLEISRDIKKWLGVGVNVSYWDNEKVDWDFFNPITGERIIIPSSIQEFKVSPFAQFIPINNTHFDFIIRAGGRFGYYHQVFNVGGYGYDESVPSFSYTLKDIGYEGFTVGYELGFELRFQIEHFIIAPSVMFANDLEANSYSALNLKVGFQID